MSLLAYLLTETTDPISSRKFDEEFKGKFLGMVQNGECTGEETLFIKIDNKFKYKRWQLTSPSSHEVVFGRDNEYREFGGAYLHEWNIVTVDEKLTDDIIDEIFEEITRKIRKPHAIWHGWFTGNPAWATPRH